MPDVSVRTEMDPLGYASLIGIKASDRLDLSAKVQAGFPFKAFNKLARFMDITSSDLAELVQISDRTLVRRKKEGKLKTGESGRLLRFARIFALVVDLFDGDPAAAQRWLSSNSVALKDRKPIEVCRTEVGAREVESLITRLERGVFV